MLTRLRDCTSDLYVRSLLNVIATSVFAAGVIKHDCLKRDRRRFTATFSSHVREGWQPLL